MAGQTDLGEMLRQLTVTRRAGTFTFVSVHEPVLLDEEIHAAIREREGTSVIITTDAARKRAWDVDFEAAWLTLEVHSSLEAVGLTAAVAQALAAESIPCNVVAGYHHDHLLVPEDRVGEAIRCLSRLAEPG